MTTHLLDSIHPVVFDLLFFIARQWKRPIASSFTEVSPKATGVFMVAFAWLCTNSTFLWPSTAEISVELENEFVHLLYSTVVTEVSCSCLGWCEQMSSTPFLFSFVSENIVTTHSWCKLREIRILVTRKKERQKNGKCIQKETPTPTQAPRFSDTQKCVKTCQRSVVNIKIRWRWSLTF